MELFYDCTTFLPLIVYIFSILFMLKIEKINNTAKLILIYFIVMLLLGIIIKINDYFYFHPFWFGHIFIPIEFTILFLYLNSFPKYLLLNKLLWGVLLALLGLQVFFSINKDGYKQFNSIFTNLFSFIIAGLSLLRLKELFINQKMIKLVNYPEFWILLAILSINILDFLVSFLNMNTYASQSIRAFYLVMIPRNLVKVGIMSMFIIGSRKYLNK